MKAFQNIVIFVLGVRKEVGIESFVKRISVACVNHLLLSLKGNPTCYGHRLATDWVLRWRGILGSEKEDSLLEFQFRNLSEQNSIRNLSRLPLVKM